MSAARKSTYKAGELRDAMPETAAWLDSMRDAFGADVVNAQIKRGIAGEPVFFASENGHTVGTARSWPPSTGEVITPDEYIKRLRDPNALPVEEPECLK